MGIMLQVRNLPEEVHAKLKQRAAEARMSLSDYVAAELTKLVRYRSNAEILADVAERFERTGLERPPKSWAADVIRAERDEREGRWDSLWS